MKNILFFGTFIVILLIISVITLSLLSQSQTNYENIVAPPLPELPQPSYAPIITPELSSLGIVLALVISSAIIIIIKRIA